MRQRGGDSKKPEVAEAKEDNEKESSAPGPHSLTTLRCFAVQCVCAYFAFVILALVPWLKESGRVLSCKVTVSHLFKGTPLFHLLFTLFLVAVLRLALASMDMDAPAPAVQVLKVLKGGKEGKEGKTNEKNEKNEGNEGNEGNGRLHMSGSGGHSNEAGAALAGEAMGEFLGITVGRPTYKCALLVFVYGSLCAVYMAWCLVERLRPETRLGPIPAAATIVLLACNLQCVMEFVLHLSIEARFLMRNGHTLLGPMWSWLLPIPVELHADHETKKDRYVATYRASF